MKKVLLIEDEEDLLCIMNATFVSEGYETVQAINGGEGYQKALLHKPDIIVTDILMPVMNGLDLCRKLKDEPTTCHIPVILITASYKKKESDDICKQYGADCILAKPYDPAELLKIAAELLSSNAKDKG